ncbi:hypothetical protein [Desulfonatronum thiodismutans]|uniref:hypothetical protein n=1 Tax=Desulfonatronum thiodismutans TaxID=159290 RepID=UPI001268C4E6|nr:hypothetical protein [Desulfonatronum thiodismutans]
MHLRAICPKRILSQKQYFVFIQLLTINFQQAWCKMIFCAKLLHARDELVQHLLAHMPHAQHVGQLAWYSLNRYLTDMIQRNPRESRDRAGAGCIHAQRGLSGYEKLPIVGAASGTPRR